MNKICPKCKKTILVTKRIYRKCKNKDCDYKERIKKSYQVKEKQYEREERTITVAPGKSEKIPVYKIKDVKELEDSKRKFIPSKMTEQDEKDLMFKIEMTQKANKRMSIEKILKKLRKNKYGLKKGTKINIEGELYTI